MKRSRVSLAVNPHVDRGFWGRSLRIAQDAAVADMVELLPSMLLL